MPRKSSTVTYTGQADTITDRLHFPATAQNRVAIWEVLGPLAAAAPGPVLELASGSGEHLAFFHQQNPEVPWRGSDPDAAHRASIRAYNPQLPEPLDLDARCWVSSQQWGGLVALNLLHIAPWSATVGLLRGAAAHLHAQGWVYLYGAYLRKGHPNAPSNLAFDADLRAQNPAWGVRWLDEVVAEAELHGLRLDSLVEMPSNNFSLIFRRISD